MDSRQLLQKRIQSIDTPSFISVISDKSIRIQRGYSCIDISILLTEGECPVVLSGISFEKDSILHSHPSLFILEEYLRNQSVSCIINVNVIKNDGNIYDMFFSGIRYLFQSISIGETVLSVDIPETVSYAIFDYSNGVDDTVKIVADPTILEEESCDALIHVINGKIMIEGRISSLALKRCISLIV